MVKHSIRSNWPPKAAGKFWGISFGVSPPLLGTSREQGGGETQAYGLISGIPINNIPPLPFWGPYQGGIVDRFLKLS